MALIKQPLLILAAAALVMLFVFWYAGREPAAAEAPKAVPSAGAIPVANAATPAPEPAAAPLASPDRVAAWIADTNSGDAQKRATAIAALADAPRADALPVLSRLLVNGEPQVDRGLALVSLRELALAQGDADGRVRDAVRQAIYHGDDLFSADQLQETLDIIEESELR